MEGTDDAQMEAGRKEGRNEGRSPHIHPSIAAAAAILRIRPWNVQVGKRRDFEGEDGGQTAVLAPRRRKGKETAVVEGSRRLYSRPEAQSSQGDRDILLFACMRVCNCI